jgi:NAD-dependent deacetylase
LESPEEIRMSEVIVNTHQVRQVARWLQRADRAVAFSGAGISTESGIPDFRSPGGVWATSQPVFYDEFLRSASARREYWRQKSLSHDGFSRAEPNQGHTVLADWQRIGRLRGVITQNIDGMHQLAGSEHVLELHGTARFVACLSCPARFEAGAMVARFVAEGQPPDCPDCGGLLKHATVSFGQELPADVLEAAIEWCTQADLLLVLGSSLVVQPAAGLPVIAKRHGARLVIINRDFTPVDRLADVVIRASIGETLGAIHAAVLSLAPASTQ